MSSKKDVDDGDSDEDVPQLEIPEKAEPEVEVVTDLSNPEVITKYQEAAKIAQATLQQIILKVYIIFSTLI